MYHTCGYDTPICQFQLALKMADLLSKQDEDMMGRVIEATTARARLSCGV
jgi:hypothetical protein